MRSPGTVDRLRTGLLCRGEPRDADRTPGHLVGADVPVAARRPGHAALRDELGRELRALEGRLPSERGEDPDLPGQGARRRHLRELIATAVGVVTASTPAETDPTTKTGTDLSTSRLLIRVPFGANDTTEGVISSAACSCAEGSNGGQAARRPLRLPVKGQLTRLHPTSGCGSSDPIGHAVLWPPRRRAGEGPGPTTGRGALRLDRLPERFPASPM